MTGTNTRPAPAAERARYTSAEGETPAARKPRPVRLARPKSLIGTPAHTGPYSRLRVNFITRELEAEQAWTLIHIRRLSVRAAARILGLSVTTTWRRAWWFNDATIGGLYGLEPGPPPQQRGTRAVPRGRPVILPLDSDTVIRDLLEQGCTLEDIAASKRTIPKCVRDRAASMAADKPGGAP